MNTREQIVKEVVDKMFEIAGHKVTYEDVKGRQDEWYSEWTMTEEQYDEWLDWMRKYLRKTLKVGINQADIEARMIGLMWGLKFSHP